MSIRYDGNDEGMHEFLNDTVRKHIEQLEEEENDSEADAFRNSIYNFNRAGVSKTAARAKVLDKARVQDKEEMNETNTSQFMKPDEQDIRGIVDEVELAAKQHREH